MASPLPNKQQDSLNDLLKDAVRDKNLSRVETCISRGAGLDCDVYHQSYNGRYNYSRPLAVYAYECYDAKIFATLAKAGLPLEAKGIDGRTALFRAVSDSNAEAVEQMLKLGASPLSEDQNGQTILAAARPGEGSMRSSSREKIVDLLLAAMTPQKDDFNSAAAKPAATTGIEDDLTVMKPITLTGGARKKDGGGLNL